MVEGLLLVAALLLLLLLFGPIAFGIALSQRNEVARLERELSQTRDWAFGLEQRIAALELARPPVGREPSRREAKRRAVRAIVQEPLVPPPSPPVEPVAAPPPVEPPPAETAAQPPAPPPPPTVASGPRWEHWIGVRGAAALGALVLVLAGLYFFRFSIEQGLLTPTLRVALGTLAGVGCVAGAESWLRNRHALLANWLSGAGIAILYSSFWAASARYGLIGIPIAAGLMVLVTALSCLLAMRRASLAIAFLGLLGGFATPALLSTGTDRPIALFAYLLVLDGALLLVAHARRWPALALVSLLGTALYQALWIGVRMGPDRLALGIGIVLVFSVVFALFARTKDEAHTDLWRLTRVTAVLAPFAFALYFGLNTSLSPRFGLVGAYLAVLVAGSSWLARRERWSFVELVATAAALGALVAWLVGHPLDAENAWEVMGVAIGIGLVLLGFVERRGPRPLTLALPGWTVGASLAISVATLSAPSTSPWVLVVGFAALAALGVRYARHEGAEVIHLPVAFALGGSVALLDLAHTGDAGFAPPVQLVMACVALSTGFALTTLVPLPREARRWRGHGAALLALLLLAHEPLLGTRDALGIPAYLGGTLLLGLVASFAAARARTGAWTLAAVVATATAHWSVVSELPASAHHDLVIAFGIETLAVLLYTAWVFALPRRSRDDRWLWRATALAGPAFFPALRFAFIGFAGNGAIAAVPIALAGISVAAVWGLGILGPTDAAVRRSAVAWLGTTALGFVTVAVPLQLENEWITIAWALQGAAVLLLWRRVDHVGLKLFAIALLATASVRLVLNPAVLDYHLRGPIPILNWLSYTYLVPAAAAFVAWAMLARVERVRLRPWETSLFPARLLPWAAKLAAFFGFAITFAWLNLEIFDLFSTGPTLRVAFEHLAARDLALSVAWAAYALVLLTLGVRRDSTGLRGLSLALMLVTCAKVFLYDLSHLQDLYRVGSLVGLALSLIAVSLAYQRFVFGKREALG